MRRFRTLLACILFPLALLAQDDAKSAYDETLKTLDQKASPPSAAQNQTIIKSTFATLEAYPTHNRARDLIRRLHDYAGEIDKKQRPIISDWFLQTRLALVDQLYKEGLNPKQLAALHAADAALATSEVRFNRSQENLRAAREKLDALSAKPETKRFIADREMAFYETVKLFNPAGATKIINALSQHADPDLAKRAQDELRILELQKAPFALTFTDHNGKPFDSAKLLNKKALFLHFWSVKKEASMKAFEGLSDIAGEFPDLVIIGINLDDEADRPAVLEAIKKRKAKWPHSIEGKGLENSVAARLNIREASAGGALFNAKGIYIKTVGRPDGIRATFNAGKPKQKGGGDGGGD